MSKRISDIDGVYHGGDYTQEQLMRAKQSIGRALRKPSLTEVEVTKLAGLYSGVMGVTNAGQVLVGNYYLRTKCLITKPLIVEVGYAGAYDHYYTVCHWCIKVSDGFRSTLKFTFAKPTAKQIRQTKKAFKLC
jgi:hypothetical protein